MAATTVLLDLDGTVWDSRPWLAHVAGGGDRSREPEALSALAAQRPAATLLREAGIGRSAFAALARGECGARLYPETLDSLNALKARGTPLGAVTNLPGWMARPMLAGLQLDE